MAIFLNAADPDFETSFAKLLGTKREESPDVRNVVAEIISDVRAEGDKAVLHLTEKFDRLALTADQMRFSKEQIAQYCAEVSYEERAALDLAAKRIRAYHQKQLPEDAQWTDPSGAELGPTRKGRLWAGAGRRCRRQGFTCPVVWPAIPLQC